MSDRKPANSSRGSSKPGPSSCSPRCSGIVKLDNLIYYFVNHVVEFSSRAPIGNRARSDKRGHATAKRLGYLPTAVARLASSPQLLDGFLKISGLFETTTLDPVAREVLIMTIATRNGCHVCVAMHTGKLTALGASADLITALRNQQPLEDERLEAIRVFTLEVLASAGAVSAASLQAFLAQDYTGQNALEVVLGIGAYTMSTLANRMTQAPPRSPRPSARWTPRATPPGRRRC